MYTLVSRVQCWVVDGEWVHDMGVGARAWTHAEVIIKSCGSSSPKHQAINNQPKHPSRALDITSGAIANTVLDLKTDRKKNL